MAAMTHSPDLDRFIELARKGKHSFASSGEKRCCLLADCVMANVGGLDNAAVIGFDQFVTLVRVDPVRANHLLRQE